ncbi:autoinducer binding domain-containing protein, partial [Stenotrophomonas maltophilia group sp. RNC7]|uniref:autoinducer binding domain-containing protein n=1 Tax=Stenotrophomonas maltophilia group sp. RNC7 TaxID=3071467 RepID=UPI0027DF46E9
MFLLEQALEDLAKVDSLSAFESYVDHLRSAYCVANMVLHVISSPRIGLSDPLIIATYEDHWKARYYERDYFRIDPVVQEGTRSFLPLDWLDIDRSRPRMRALFAEAESNDVGTQGIS